MTLTSASEQTIQTLEITRTEEIRAAIEIVFETLLEQLGPLNETPEGVSLAMKIEPWPGGRWFRDLGDNNGHLWGHVQAIKRPTLLEIYGPLFMSYPATSNVQYRLTAEGAVTRIQFVHRAIGLIPAEHRDRTNVDKGWTYILTKVREVAERKSS
jgi:Activator of Hsp90 ATPase homolog 1-like protein